MKKIIIAVIAMVILSEAAFVWGFTDAEINNEKNLPIYQAVNSAGEEVHARQIDDKASHDDDKFDLWYCGTNGKLIGQNNWYGREDYQRVADFSGMNGNEPTFKGRNNNGGIAGFFGFNLYALGGQTFTRTVFWVNDRGVVESGTLDGTGTKGGNDKPPAGIKTFETSAGAKDAAKRSEYFLNDKGEITNTAMTNPPSGAQLYTSSSDPGLLQQQKKYQEDAAKAANAAAPKPVEGGAVITLNPNQPVAANAPYAAKDSDPEYLFDPATFTTWKKVDGEYRMYNIETGQADSQSKLMQNDKKNSFREFSQVDGHLLVDKENNKHYFDIINNYEYVSGVDQDSAGLFVYDIDTKQKIGEIPHLPFLAHLLDTNVDIFNDINFQDFQEKGIVKINNDVYRITAGKDIVEKGKIIDGKFMPNEGYMFDDAGKIKATVRYENGDASTIKLGRNDNEVSIALLEEVGILDLSWSINDDDSITCDGKTYRPEEGGRLTLMMQDHPTIPQVTYVRMEGGGVMNIYYEPKLDSNGAIVDSTPSSITVGKQTIEASDLDGLTIDKLSTYLESGSEQQVEYALSRIGRGKIKLFEYSTGDTGPGILVNGNRQVQIRADKSVIYLEDNKVKEISVRGTGFTVQSNGISVPVDRIDNYGILYDAKGNVVGRATDEFVEKHIEKVEDGTPSILKLGGTDLVNEIKSQSFSRDDFYDEYGNIKEWDDLTKEDISRLKLLGITDKKSFNEEREQFRDQEYMKNQGIKWGLSWASFYRRNLKLAADMIDAAYEGAMLAQTFWKEQDRSLLRTREMFEGWTVDGQAHKMCDQNIPSNVAYSFNSPQIGFSPGGRRMIDSSGGIVVAASINGKKTTINYRNETTAQPEKEYIYVLEFKASATTGEIKIRVSTNNGDAVQFDNGLEWLTIKEGGSARYMGESAFVKVSKQDYSKVCMYIDGPGAVYIRNKPICTEFAEAYNEYTGGTEMMTESDARNIPIFKGMAEKEPPSPSGTPGTVSAGEEASESHTATW
ncbi:hypothetical protein JXA85_04850 [Candidatus Woesearchaeota archaeon]|nr:hypothetical protein [Candidatus Woesearchaeota archaeon]